MAGRSSVPIDEVEAALMADWSPMVYFGSSYHGNDGFQNGMAPASTLAGADQTMGAPVDVSSLVDSIGMTPAGFEMPEVALAATDFGVVGGEFPAGGTMSSQQQIGSNKKPPASLKASSWTEEEDSILREMVLQHGERKWSVIAQCIPGRIGKQCRERWINYLRPNIKQNDAWTEDEDRMLINAHKFYGNRWSSIAKYLPGRSENAIKNHWNATLRSLKAQRRMKKRKSEQVPTGQFSALEEYIRSQWPKDAVPAAPPPLPLSAPQPHLAYGSGLLHPAAHAPAAGSATIPTNREMSFHGDNSAAGSANLAGMINLNMPQTLPDPNTISGRQEYYLNYATMYAPAPAPQMHLTPTQDPMQVVSNLDLSPYAEYFALLCPDYGRYNYAGASSSNPAGANGYYNEAGRGAAGAGGGDPAARHTDGVVE